MGVKPLIFFPGVVFFFQGLPPGPHYMHICYGPNTCLFLSTRGIHPPRKRVYVPTSKIPWHRMTIPRTRALEHGEHGVKWYTTKIKKPAKRRTCPSVLCPLLRNSGERKRTSEACLCGLLAQAKELLSHKTW